MAETKRSRSRARTIAELLADATGDVEVLKVDPVPIVPVSQELGSNAILPSQRSRG
jgi:hypothetical protein